jgi:hypothetical protein
VPATAVQVALRQAFARWGKPQLLRVDNGTPWGATGGLPTELALWLLGLSVRMLWNPPRRPQRNGVVERSQGVGQRWGEPQSCASAAELQARLDELDGVQREEYPHQGELSRMQTYPGLAHSGRGYQAADEAGQWSLERVLEYLADNPVLRKVDSNGKVSLYDRPHWVGKRHSGKVVYVTLDPQDKHWVIEDEQGCVLKRREASELSAESICTLSVSRIRAEEGGQTS